ncbi:MAG: hypothetical protein JWN43_5078 [Gammaproteobacteria bacterium]|nr:hypothetical protein [Gammaproteobacteria bacterium]
MTSVNRPWRIALAAVFVILNAGADPVAPSDVQTTEYAIKAAFLCKFGNYVEWPPQPATAPETPFGIGVVAAEPVVDELVRAARGQTVNGRAIAVRRLAGGDPVNGLDILFVARSHSARLAETLAAARGQPILTVTESDRGIPDGSIVNFVVVADKVKFDIALERAEQSNLKISARLLGVARLVSGRASQ